MENTSQTANILDLQSGGNTCDILRFIDTHYDELAARYNPPGVPHMPVGSYLKGYVGLRPATVADALFDMKYNAVYYHWLDSVLADERSREVLRLQLLYRASFRDELLPLMTDKGTPQYFDTDIVSVSENEVFVDCGGFTGDTVQSYRDCFGAIYKRIYVYEPVAENFRKCSENLADTPRVVLRPFAVSDTAEEAYMDEQGSSSAIHGGGDSAEKVHSVTLDEDIAEPVTFIKMDVECFEAKALRGARNHIAKDSPKLAICVYHLLSDLWELPLYINALNTNYKFYLRHYNISANWETVIYCIPK
jgi:FkbM family methyltransferase